ncbi:MAG TPA: OB-fold domain-containing protein [Ilumatobacter sp.]|nr:OB-fold domain-containing protein [Ilumatobacter sp.]
MTTPRIVTTKLEFPYSRSLGAVTGAFAAGLRDQRLLATKTVDDRVLFPPLEYDPATGQDVQPDLVEVGPLGTVESWSWVPNPTARHPYDRPFAFALIAVDGADTGLIHVLTADSPTDISSGMRVRPRWKADRVGKIDDIEGWEPAE